MLNCLCRFFSVHALRMSRVQLSSKALQKRACVWGGEIADAVKYNMRNAAAIFAQFFHARHIAEAAEGEDWQEVRRLVNGGVNGCTLFTIITEHLKRIV